MEGPSVHRVADLTKRFKGQVIKSVTGNSKQPIQHLENKLIRKIRAVKKRLIVETNTHGLVVQFLMYGSYRINKKRKKMNERVSLLCEKDILNLYNCSVKILDKKSIVYDYYNRIEEDVLYKKFDKHRAIKKAKKDSRTLADVLLDQEIFGGVGNIIKNEALYRAGIHPNSTSSKLLPSRMEKLVDITISWTKSWLNCKRKGIKKRLKIYRKNKCLKCGLKLEIGKTGFNPRVSYYCEKCQK